MHGRDFPCVTSFTNGEREIQRERDLFAVLFALDLARGYQPSHFCRQAAESHVVREVLLALVKVFEEIGVGIFDFIGARPDLSRAGANDDRFRAEDFQHSFEIMVGHGVIVLLEQSANFLQFGIGGFRLFDCGFSRLGGRGKGGDCTECGEPSDDGVAAVHTSIVGYDMSL